MKQISETVYSSRNDSIININTNFMDGESENVNKLIYQIKEKGYEIPDPDYIPKFDEFIKYMQRALTLSKKSK